MNYITAIKSLRDNRITFILMLTSLILTVLTMSEKINYPFYYLVIVTMQNVKDVFASKHVAIFFYFAYIIVYYGLLLISLSTLVYLIFKVKNIFGK